VQPAAGSPRRPGRPHLPPALRWLLGRTLQSLAGLCAVVTATFVAMHLIPGDPFSDPRLPPAVRARLLALYGLDRPWPVQYATYLAGLLRGQLGWSLTDPHRSVGAMIVQGLPASATLGALALAWSVPAGCALGLWAAWRRGRWPDHLAVLVAVAGLSVPSFVLAVLLDYLFGVRLRLLPVAGWGSPAQAILPALALGATPFALVARLTRAEAAEVLAADFIQAARARGLSWPQVLRRHVLRNALLPVVTALGPLTAGILTGSLVIESVFAVPGLGRDFVQSVLDRDYPLILGTTVFYAALLIACNLLADVALAVCDPRIRLHGGEPG
jgi:oligopeptide transport system permease protein